MSLLLVGELRDVRTRRAGNEANSWDECVLYVLSGVKVEVVAVASGRDFNFRGVTPTPEDVGNVVALDVGVSTYVNREGKARFNLTAYGRKPEIEAALAATPAALAAVS